MSEYASVFSTSTRFLLLSSLVDSGGGSSVLSFFLPCALSPIASSEMRTDDSVAMQSRPIASVLLVICLILETQADSSRYCSRGAKAKRQFNPTFLAM